MTIAPAPAFSSSGADLDFLFRPRSVAVVGASSDPRRFGGRPIQYMLEAGFAGAIYPVNPARQEIQGLAAYPSIEAVGAPIDCALLALGADDTQAALNSCIVAGVKVAILYGAGFSEMGVEGEGRQRRLVETARAGGMRLLGPNCMGALNSHARFYGTFASAMEEGVPPPGRIAVASQSGGYGGYLMKHLFRRGLGVSHWATTGNEADLAIGDVLHWMAGQDENDVILLYLEGVRSGASLLAGLERARRNDKPVVVMKVGRTSEGSAAAASHTASLTGEDSVYDAVFAAHGAYRARTTDELLDVAYALSKGRLPKGRSVGVVSISGGVGVQIADFVSDAGLAMGTVPEPTQAQLTALVPNCAPRNPIDMTGLVTTNHEIMEKTLDALLASSAFDATLVFLGIAGAARSMARPLQQAIANAHGRHPDHLMFVSITADPEMVREYDGRGFLVFEDPSRAVTALGALCHFAGLGDVPPPLPLTSSAPLPDGAFNEAQAKALIASHGVRGPREKLASSPAEAARMAVEIGFPVAVKIVSADILHKTEYGGVALGLLSAEQVEAAVRRMAENIPARLPDARIDGYLVSEMVAGGVECIVGCHSDPAFGPVITFGLGGTLVELLNDTVCALAPVSVEQARAMIGKVRTYPLLAGYRGGAQHDVAALAEAVSSLSVLAAAQAGRIAAIEVNPLVALETGAGVVALDAVIETVQRL